MARYPIWKFEQKTTYIKKGTWTPEEDYKLRAYIHQYGIWNWNEMPKFAGLFRTGKSCRLRWMNYLRPGIKRGNFTKEDEDTILKLHKIMGNRWSAIAQMMPERTDNEIKNYFNTRLKKRANRIEENSHSDDHHDNDGHQEGLLPAEIMPNGFAPIHKLFSTEEENIEGNLFEIYGELQGFWDQPPMLEDVLASKFADLYS